MKQLWLKSYLRDPDLKNVSAAIREVELNTSGEVVAMVVRRSSAVGHIPLLLTLAFTVLFLFFELGEHVLNWAHLPYWSWPLVILLFYFISVALSKFAFLQRWLTPQLDQAEQVMRRAQLEFFTNGVNKTNRSTAILIFLSIMERRVIVLADEAIAKKLPPNTWQDEIDIILNAIKHGRLGDGLVQAIHQVGAHLRQAFPAHKVNENELSNELLIKE